MRMCDPLRYKPVSESAPQDRPATQPKPRMLRLNAGGTWQIDVGVGEQLGAKRGHALRLLLGLAGKQAALLLGLSPRRRACLAPLLVPLQLLGRRRLLGQPLLLFLLTAAGRRRQDRNRGIAPSSSPCCP